MIPKFLYFLMIFMIVRPLFVFASDDNPIACLLTFDGLAEAVAISKSQFEAMSYFKDMVDETTRIGLEKTQNIPLSFDAIDSIPNMVRKLFLPIIDKSSGFPFSFNLQTSEVVKTISLIDIIKEQKEGIWGYIDFKNATRLSLFLNVKKIVGRAFANCWYDEKEEYFKNLDKARSEREIFDMGPIISDNLLLAIDDVKDATKSRSIKSLDTGFYRLTLDFSNNNIRSLRGISALLKRYLGVQVLDLKDNFIQEIDELQDFQLHNQLITIDLSKNRLSNCAKLFCAENNRKFNNIAPDEILAKNAQFYKHESNLAAMTILLYGVLGVATLWKMGGFLENNVTHWAKKSLPPSKLFHFLSQKNFKLRALLLATSLGIGIGAGSFLDKKFPGLSLSKVNFVLALGMMGLLHVSEFFFKKLFGFGEIPHSGFYIIYDE